MTSYIPDSGRETALFLMGCLLVLIVGRAIAWHAFLRIRSLIHWLLETPGQHVWQRTVPAWELFCRRFPRLGRFLERRFYPDSFVGLPLTLMIAAAAYTVFLAGGIVQELLEAKEIVQLDESINASLGPWRTRPLVLFFDWITEFGGSECLTVAALMATGFLWSHGRTEFLLPLWVAIAGSQATTWTGKYAFDRARPEFETITTALTPSFPSAHAASAMAVYGFIAFALVRDLDTKRRKFKIAYWLGVLIVLIGFSRVYLSVHYTSDVAMGFLVGIFWLLVSFGLFEFLRHHRVEVARAVDAPLGPEKQESEESDQSAEPEDSRVGFASEGEPPA